MLRPQSFIVAQRDKSCAVEAALEAVDGFYNLNLMERAKEIWPYLYNKVQCPVCLGVTDGTITWVIGLHLNDRHHWTREVIAGWLEKLERQLGVAEISYDAKEVVHEPEAAYAGT